MTNVNSFSIHGKKIPQKKRKAYAAASLSYPFILFDKRDTKIPTVPYAHFGGNAICQPVYGYNGKLASYKILETEELRQKFDYEIYSFHIAEELYTKGIEMLSAITEKIPERKKDNARRIIAVAEFIRNTIRTAINVKEFYKRKEALLNTHGEERNKLIDEMIGFCKADIENAKATIPIVEFDSRIGYEPSMEYMCDRAHIEWKLDLMKDLIEKELPSYYEKTESEQK